MITVFRVCAAALALSSATGVLADQDSGPLSFPEWPPVFTEYTRAQTSDWLDDEQFAVGRWDGTISVFRRPMSGEYTPVLTNVWRTHDGSGVEMLHSLDGNSLMFSNGPSAVSIRTLDGSSSQADFTYDPAFGVANSALSGNHNGQQLVITGHANGQIVIWNRIGSTIELVDHLNLASPDPIPSPSPLSNVRGLAWWGDGLVVAGSEDGDLTIVDLESREITYRMRYNEGAQRGINSISVVGDYLLVANCSVGHDDNNLWLFEIGSATSINLLHAIDLKDDLSRPQSFNFDADLIDRSGELQFYASTEEGLLWAGQIQNGELVPIRTAYVASEGGALLDFNPSLSILLAAARKLYLFEPL